jgi:hypothetical protein
MGEHPLNVTAGRPPDYILSAVSEVDWLGCLGYHVERFKGFCRFVLAVWVMVSSQACTLQFKETILPCDRYWNVKLANGFPSSAYSASKISMLGVDSASAKLLTQLISITLLEGIVFMSGWGRHT